MTRAFTRAETGAGVAVCVLATAIALLPSESKLIAAGLLAVILLIAWAATSQAGWVLAFVAAVLIVPPLPADIGNSGVHPALILAVVGVYAGVLWRNRWRGDAGPVGRYATALAVVMFASVAMALVYSGLAIAAGSAARVLLFAVTPWLFVYMAAGPGRVLAEGGLRHARMLFTCGVASAVFACLDFVYQFPAPSGYSPQYIWLEDRVLRRAQGLFYDAGALGNICAFFIVMAAVCIVVRGRPAVNPWLAALGAIPLGAALVLSYSRAALLNVAAAVIALLIVRWRDVRWFRVAVVFPAGVVSAGAIALVMAPVFTQAWAARLARTVELASAAADTAVSGRLSSWDTIAAFAVAHPLRVAVGVGYKTIAYSDVLGRELIADNTWLSVLVETGIAGVAALLALNAAILWTTFRAARSSNPRAAFYGTWAFAFWIGEMVQMCAADLLTWWRLLPVVFFVIAMATIATRQDAA
ncbi:MAG TPA: O-antigen ligase family protein [Bryobacteraceae bacterium]|nr:O-antigen ligase family protein [Bryobacteraceae bacterium]